VRRICVLLALLGTLAAPGSAAAYSWPLKPFDEQHPIRAYFDDPRLLFGADSFHFGIDICAADGTPVYAVAPGVAHVHSDNVAIVSGAETFGYWHVKPEVAQDAHVELHQRIGTVIPRWGHVHFAESVGGVYVNPLRPGALEPYVDTTSPTIAGISAQSRGKPVLSQHVTGTVGLVATAFDTPPAPLPPAPWSLTRVTPAVLKWRIVRDTAVVRPWHTVVDFRNSLLPPELFTTIYAPGTTQNRANHPGRYRFWLTRTWDTRSLADGLYRIEVAAYDTQGNSGHASAVLRIANQSRSSR
jgi:hypothetical protein